MMIRNVRAAATLLPMRWVLGGPGRYAVAVFLSAGLVFLVEPMAARMLLPFLGGSPAVWNTSLAFFQAALLGGYAYAHLLQRLTDVRRQMVVHLALLAVAALTLPLAVSRWPGDPDTSHPILWLLAELLLTLGAPFTLLSATAPLLQSWFARRIWPEGHGPEARDAYPLYAASNLGSLLALAAYPLLVEPFTTLTVQRHVWSVAFVMFGALVLVLRLTERFTDHPTVPVAPDARTVSAPGLPDILRWTLLAALPSSLMLGVTSHLTTDIASFPFLWVLPLALYLTTFIIAFGGRDTSRRGFLLALQVATTGGCVLVLPLLGLGLGLGWQVVVTVANFFVAALVCHLALADRRPDPRHLTSFYLWMSVGGGLGGAFNAFLAPVIFSNVVEYPLVLVLILAARPWNGWKLDREQGIILLLGLVASMAPAVATGLGGRAFLNSPAYGQVFIGATFSAFAAAILLRNRGLWFTVLLGGLSLGIALVPSGREEVSVQRSFFGVLRLTDTGDPVVGPVRMMFHGTTIHGAQSLSPARRCQPLTYYAPQTGIGQTVIGMQAVHPAIRIGAVGLGVGSLASYTRPGDEIDFFEIDPLVIREASNPQRFTYTTACAKGVVRYVLGDARLTLSRLPEQRFNLLVIDAFSSDTVPAHLLTVEAMKMYLARLEPDGVLLMHLSNRHLDLRDPVIAGLRAAGARTLTQHSKVHPRSFIAFADTQTVMASRSRAALAPFAADPRWVDRNPGQTRPWTDDYSNLIGPLIAGLRP